MATPRTNAGAAPRGRGAASNPANRFEPLLVEREEPGPDRVPTQLLADRSRTVIARNDSPDLGFDTSVNPYRGCEHGCVYCLDGDTPILLGDGATRPLRALRVGDAIYGTERSGSSRRLVRTRVLAHWETTNTAFAVTLADGTRLVAGPDHRFLTARGWKFVTGGERSSSPRPRLELGDELVGTGRFASAPDGEDEGYRRGYLAGLIRGDDRGATYAGAATDTSRRGAPQFRLALVDREPLDRSRRYLAAFGIVVDAVVLQQAVGDHRPLDAISTPGVHTGERVRELVAMPLDVGDSWCRGFLAGIYDAEGSFTGKTLRIATHDRELTDHTTACLRRLGLGFAIETRRPGGPDTGEVVRLTGGLDACLRFWHTTDNAITRKREISGRALEARAALLVRSIEPLGDGARLFDITTGTGDFIADGVVSHNCYARPFHEYLGFSPGLDFETKILVKENAPELLRRELMAPSWQPQVLMMSGVTDCYQPAERRLEITRRCLAVLAEFRNPVSIVTKNHLVTRDADLLAELAGHRAAAVTLSITTLDSDLARRMEPRASAPRDRLDALTRLSAAGVPCGVNVAPVIPGLTDHEMPAILAAAKEAGAGWANFMVVRLPFAVKDLFQDWLAEHFPERKDKVLARIRALRGGKLNESEFGKRFRGEGVFAEQLHQLFQTTCRRLELPRSLGALSKEDFRRPGQQLGLFGDC